MGQYCEVCGTHISFGRHDNTAGRCAVDEIMDQLRDLDLEVLRAVLLELRAYFQEREHEE